MDLVGPGALLPHFEDSARAVSWLDAVGRWADLGSGAGFPGISLAARHENARVELVESRRKRSIFLQEVVAESGLKNASVHHGRVEELQPGVYDGVVSRAFRPPLKYLATALPLLVPGGVALLLLARGQVPSVEGLEVFHVEHYDLDGRPRQAVGYRRLS